MYFDSSNDAVLNVFSSVHTSSLVTEFLKKEPCTSRFEVLRGTQRIVSVNYLFGRPLIPYDFLKGIFTSNFRDMGNLRPSSFRIDINVVSGTDKRSAKIFRKEIRPIII